MQGMTVSQSLQNSQRIVLQNVFGADRQSGGTQIGEARQGIPEAVCPHTFPNPHGHGVDFKITQKQIGCQACCPKHTKITTDFLTIESNQQTALASFPIQIKPRSAQLTCKRLSEEGRVEGRNEIKIVAGSVEKKVADGSTDQITFGIGRQEVCQSSDKRMIIQIIAKVLERTHTTLRRRADKMQRPA
jgi:hypothetical protein